jgi:adenosylcobinamide-GDP ribazoletransferase
VNSFFAALQFLTLCPWPARVERSAEEVGRSAIFFPAIGLALGSMLVLLNRLLQPFASSGLLSVILIAALLLATRGLHLDGLADTFDGLGAGGDRERVLRIMDDSHTGVFGVAAIVVVLFLKTQALDSLGDGRWRALLMAPVLSRWTMVLLAYHANAAKAGLGALFIGHLKAQHFLGATLMTLLLIAAIGQLLGIALMVWLALFTLACKHYFHRRLGGVTGDTFGAVGELSESSVMVAMALVSR